jgi:uncharacterized membrane protein YhaH (DUF805 family)
VGLVILLAVSCAVLLMAVVLDFAGIVRRKPGLRWSGTGLLIMNVATLVNSYADARGGPYPRTPLHWFTWPLVLAGFALLVIGLRVQFRELHRTRRSGG